MGMGLLGVYCIAVPVYGMDPLEIYSAAVLKQRWYRRSSLLIVGLSDSLFNAELLSAEILRDIFAARGDYDSKRYFMNPGSDRLPEYTDRGEEKA